MKICNLILRHADIYLYSMLLVTITQVQFNLFSKASELEQLNAIANGEEQQLQEIIQVLDALNCVAGKNLSV